MVLGTFWVPLGSLWSPNGAPEALLLEVEILMAKRVVRKLAGLGGNLQDLAALGGNLGARP